MRYPSGQGGRGWAWERMGDEGVKGGKGNKVTKDQNGNKSQEGSLNDQRISPVADV